MSDGLLEQAANSLAAAAGHLDPQYMGQVTSNAEVGVAAAHATMEGIDQAVARVQAAGGQMALGLTQKLLELKNQAEQVQQKQQQLLNEANGVLGGLMEVQGQLHEAAAQVMRAAQS